MHGNNTEENIFHGWLWRRRHIARKDQQPSFIFVWKKCRFGNTIALAEREREEGMCEEVVMGKNGVNRLTLQYQFVPIAHRSRGKHNKSRTKFFLWFSPPVDDVFLCFFTGREEIIVHHRRDDANRKKNFFVLSRPAILSTFLSSDISAISQKQRREKKRLQHQFRSGGNEKLAEASTQHSTSCEPISECDSDLCLDTNTAFSPLDGKFYFSGKESLCCGPFASLAQKNGNESTWRLCYRLNGQSLGVCFRNVFFCFVYFYNSGSGFCFIGFHVFLQNHQNWFVSLGLSQKVNWKFQRNDKRFARTEVSLAQCRRLN